MPNNIPINPSFCSFASFLIVSLTPFINKPVYSSDLAIFIISFISSFEIINFATPYPKIFLGIATSVADSADVNPNGIKRLMANGLDTFPIKRNQGFVNGPKSLTNNPLDCRILCN